VLLVMAAFFISAVADRFSHGPRCDQRGLEFFATSALALVAIARRGSASFGLALALLESVASA